MTTTRVSEQSKTAVPTSPKRNWALLALGEGLLVAIALFSACAIAAAVGHPASPLASMQGLPRRASSAALAALVTVALIYSPLGQRSGPMLNPAITLAFFRLGRLSPRAASWVILAHFTGALAGLLLARLLLGALARDVRYAVVLPGQTGVMLAWIAEFFIGLMLVCTVFTVNRTRLVRFTGFFAAALLALIATIESPVSGAGVNAARTFASSLYANLWTGWWIYFTAPPLGMLAGIELLRVLGLSASSMCGKLTHTSRSFFACRCLTPWRDSDTHALSAAVSHHNRQENAAEPRV